MATGLKRYSGGQGLAPYGLRHSGDSVKGSGYFGKLDTPDGGAMTEYSAEDEQGEYPLVVPTLTKKELGHLVSGKGATEEIEAKAQKWADSRRKQGKSPFAEAQGLRYPAPKEDGKAFKRGGAVRSASKRADGVAQRGKTRGRIVK